MKSSSIQKDAVQLVVRQKYFQTFHIFIGSQSVKVSQFKNHAPVLSETLQAKTNTSVKLMWPMGHSFLSF